MAVSSIPHSEDGKIGECDIGITLVQVAHFDVDELELVFKLALKRLIKFRGKEREKFGEVPSVPNDPLCLKAYECMQALQKRAEEAGFKLELKL